MKNKLNIFSVLIVSVILIPQIALASWWNPFTWKIFNKKINNTEQVENIVKEVPVEQKTLEDDKTTTHSNSPVGDYLKSLDSEVKPKEVNKNKVDTSNITTNNNLDKEKQYLELLSLLESDKNNFQLLDKSYKESKKKSIDLLTNSLNEWINLMDSSIISVTDDFYKTSLLSLKKETLTTISDGAKKITESYDLIHNLYLKDSFSDKENIEVIAIYEEGLKKCISDNYKGTRCNSTNGIFSLVTGDHNLFLSKLDNGLISIDKTNGLVLDLVGTYIDSTQRDYTYITKQIKNKNDLMESIQNQQAQLDAKLNQVTNYQAPSKLICKTEASGGLLNKTYKTTCLPDTRTAQQICNDKIAAWSLVAQYMPDSKPSCAE